MTGSRQRRNAISRREFLRYSSSGVAIAALGPLIAACGDGTTATTATTGPAGSTSTTALTGAPSGGGVLQLSVGFASNSDRLDPALIRAGNDGLVCAQIYERLTRFDADWVVSPELAERWDVSDDAREWTFYLRPNVQFHDGTILTSEDVAHTMARILDEDLGSPHFGTISQSLDPDGIVAVDDTTITFRLKAPNSLFPLAVGDKKAGVVKVGTGEVTLDNAIGTGPFRAVSFVPGESWEVARHDSYWGEGLPYLDGIRLINIADPAAQLESILSGDSHLGTVRDFTAAQQVVNSDQSDLLEAENAGFVYIAMNKAVAPFDDPRVVEAIKLAVDREQMLTTALHEYGTLTTDVQVVSTSQYYPADLGIRSQNLDRSRELLADAGYSDGIDLELFTSTGLLGMREHATVFTEMVAPAGIRVDITEWDPATYFTDIWLQEPFYVSFFNARHPSQMLSLLYVSDASWPEQGFSDPRVDEIFEEAGREIDLDRQAELYQEAIRLIADGAGSSVASSVSKLYAQKAGVLAGVRPDGEETFLLKEAHFT